MLDYEKFFTKYPNAGWIEDGEPHFNMESKIDPEATFWVDCAGSVYYCHCKTGAYHPLTPYLVKGYPTVRIHGENLSVSRLVALNFLYRPEGTTDVHHKDGNKLNNRYTNLIWLTHEKHMEIHHGKAVVMLAPDTHKLLATFPSASAAAKEMNIPVTSIRSCTNHQTKSSHGYIWMKAAEYFHTEEAA